MPGIAYHPQLPQSPDMSVPPLPMRAFRSSVALLVAVLVLAGCSSTSSWDPRRWFSKQDDAPKPAARELPGIEARLRSINSSVTGWVRLRESGDLLVVFVDLTNGRPGPYRVVLHANGNCTSPNGFSAGAPYAPPGWKESPLRLIPEVTANINGMGQLTARVKGARLGDALKGSVLVYEGVTPQVPQPDVRNNVVACGTFEQSRTLF
jgi:hypothetical protein